MSGNSFHRDGLPRAVFVLPKQQRSETACEVHVHQEHVPWERHHIIPQEYHGPSVDWNYADICSNAHGNVHYLLSTLLKAAASVNTTDLGTALRVADWDYVRTFGVQTREIAYAGFRGIMSAKVTPAGLEYESPRTTRAGGLRY